MFKGGFERCSKNRMFYTLNIDKPVSVISCYCNAMFILSNKVQITNVAG